MVTRINCLLCTLLVCLGASSAWGQTSLAELQKALREKANFEEKDFAAMKLHQPVVRAAPVSEKREIAVTGLINIHASPQEFLRAYLDGMGRKNNPAILEIGRFTNEPALTDVDSLTLEKADIEDLKDCVIGDCDVKLSAAMIERFRREIDWSAADYQSQAARLFKQMLVEYVRDYRARGESALIEYNDKENEVSLASEQRELSSASGYVSGVLADSNSGLKLLEEALVWSKVKFGLKPVIAVNHISVYQRESEVGPRILIASKQIYANHYFNASLALTAFVSVADAPQGAYLVYENRSRADGLDGPLGKIRRAVVEKKALEGLRNILEHSQASLGGSALTARTEEIAARTSWGQRLFGGVRPLLWLLVLSALIALLVLGRRRLDGSSASKRKPLKPESAKS